MSRVSHLDLAEFTAEAGRKFALYCHYAIVVGSGGGYGGVFFQMLPFIVCNCISLLVFFVLAICSLVVVPIIVTALDLVCQQKQTHKYRLN